MQGFQRKYEAKRNTKSRVGDIEIRWGWAKPGRRRLHVILERPASDRQLRAVKKVADRLFAESAARTGADWPIRKRHLVLEHLLRRHQRGASYQELADRLARHKERTRADPEWQRIYDELFKDAGRPGRKYAITAGWVRSALRRWEPSLARRQFLAKERQWKRNFREWQQRIRDPLGLNWLRERQQWIRDPSGINRLREAMRFNHPSSAIQELMRHLKDPFGRGA